jgi:anti-sigma regulatory factor (Ser/Thr protein kinase)
MPVARLILPATADQARTARLVAGTAAQRAGVPDAALDDVRLAVAEAVSLAVHAARRAPARAAVPQVEVALADDGREFTVTVVDTIPVTETDAEVREMSLPLIRALAERSTVEVGETGGRTVQLAWSIAPRS